MKKPLKLLNMSNIFSNNSPPPMPFHLKKSNSRLNNRYDNDTSFSCLRSSKSPSMRMTANSQMNVTMPEHFRSVRETIGTTKTAKPRSKRRQIPNKAIYHEKITPNSGYFHTFLKTINRAKNVKRIKKKRKSKKNGIRRSRSVIDIKKLADEFSKP